MRRAVGGVAVVTARRDVDTASGGLTVHRGLVDLDGMVDQDLVFGRQIEVFMTGAACLGQVDGMSLRAFDAGRQDVMVSMAVVTVGRVEG